MASERDSLIAENAELRSELEGFKSTLANIEARHSLELHRLRSQLETPGQADSDESQPADKLGTATSPRSGTPSEYTAEDPNDELSFQASAPIKENYLAIFKRWARRQPNLIKLFAFTVVVTILMYVFCTGANSELCKALNYIMTAITENQSIVFKAFGVQVAAGVGVFMYYFYDFLFGADKIAAEFHP
ncbi:hypothetical protein CYMTET_23803 [Cymbomonas tetramitiformis]|uniref:Uncharacterized protein n=1 Tax=Cymbomonas tetramitiformis TaxID=36881 RepID=A0AAE0FXG5_9CHLO|nr:hypothetical protein CYMTET_23803 [Cymbomonas tetramitiformis]